MRHRRKPSRGLTNRVRDLNLSASAITAANVARIWRVYPRHRPGLYARARETGMKRKQVKLDAAAMGLWLAYGDIHDSPPAAGSCRVITPEEVVSRALYHAARIVTEHTERALPDLYVRDERAKEDLESRGWAQDLAECLDPTSNARERVQDLLEAVSESASQRALVQAFLEGNCTTVAEASRYLGWSRGTATKQAARLREKARRLKVSSPNAYEV